MELNQAMKIVLDLARQNVIQDPEMAEEHQAQADAIEAVEQFVVESLGANPSPVKVVMVSEGAVIHELLANVPVDFVLLDKEDWTLEDVEQGLIRAIEDLDGDEHYVGRPEVQVDPMRVATIYREATE